MFKIRRIKALQDNTPSGNLANEVINEQGSCATVNTNQMGRGGGGGGGYHITILVYHVMFYPVTTRDNIQNSTEIEVGARFARNDYGSVGDTKQVGRGEQRSKDSDRYNKLVQYYLSLVRERTGRIPPLDQNNPKSKY